MSYMGEIIGMSEMREIFEISKMIKDELNGEMSDINFLKWVIWVKWVTWVKWNG